MLFNGPFILTCITTVSTLSSIREGSMQDKREFCYLWFLLIIFPVYIKLSNSGANAFAKFLSFCLLWFLNKKFVKDKFSDGVLITRILFQVFVQYTFQILSKLFICQILKISNHKSNLSNQAAPTPQIRSNLGILN